MTDCGSLLHGIECPMVCTQLVFKCTVVVGEKDALRQPDGMQEARGLGVTVTVVAMGCMTLRAAANEVMRVTAVRFENAYHLMSCPIGPHPY